MTGLKDMVSGEEAKHKKAVGFTHGFFAADRLSTLSAWLFRPPWCQHFFFILGLPLHCRRLFRREGVVCPWRRRATPRLGMPAGAYPAT